MPVAADWSSVASSSVAFSFGDALCLPFNLPSLYTAVPYLLKQRDAITNWADFKAGNNISGWDESTEVCRWSYIHCRQDHAYAVTFSCAYANTKCTPKAIGTLAPELANAK